MKRLVVMLIALLYILVLSDMLTVNTEASTSQSRTSLGLTGTFGYANQVYSPEQDLCYSFDVNFIPHQQDIRLQDYSCIGLSSNSLLNKYSFNPLGNINSSRMMFFLSERPLVWSKLSIYIRKQSFLI